jgi:hypothetical protein
MPPNVCHWGCNAISAEFGAFRPGAFISKADVNDFFGSGRTFSEEAPGVTGPLCTLTFYCVGGDVAILEVLISWRERLSQEG